MGPPSGVSRSGNLHFMKQAPNDPEEFDVVMPPESTALEPRDQRQLNDGKAGALKLAGDKPSIKFGAGPLWKCEVGSTWGLGSWQPAFQGSRRQRSSSKLRCNDVELGDGGSLP